jgi:uncharacterized protein
MTGTVLIREDAEGWQGRLYRPARPQTYHEVETRFVPYFAWDNRGSTEMTVWIPGIR